MGPAFRLNARLRNLRHWLRTSDYAKLRGYEQRRTGRARLPWPALIAACWRHGASFDDYYQLRFFEKDAAERARWLTASLRHELTRQVNDAADIVWLQDKIRFAEKFGALTGRPSFTADQLAEMTAYVETAGRLVVKPARGQVGAGIVFFEGDASAFETLFRSLDRPETYLYEAFIDQHPDMARLSAGAVNTVRVFTFLREDGEVEIWGTILRMAVDKMVDNLSAGGFAAAIDPDGTIRRHAVSMDPFVSPVTRHPTTGAEIVGFEVPHFAAALEMVRTAARMIPTVRSVGWDVAVTAEGPCLVEGNDNWGRNILQLPYGRGRLDLAERVADMRQVYG